MKDWYSARELAGLPGLPGTARRVLSKAQTEEWQSRRREKSKGKEYALASLPAATQAKLLMRGEKDRTEAPATEGPLNTDERHQPPQWSRYERLPDKTKAEAMRKLNAVDALARMTAAGTAWMDAYGKIAAELGEHPATLRRWWATVKNVPRADWLPALAPRYTGRTATAECSPEAWDWFKAVYLRLEAPALESCYRLLEQTAPERGWVYPSLRTLSRRMRKEVPRQVFILKRHGPEALDRIYPPQERLKDLLSALECVNADGHKFDVFVKFEDGTVGRAMLVAWQDIYSGKILSWRVGQTECVELVRLSFGDVVEHYGIPAHAYLDNGRAFASKWMTGHMKWRHRFKVKDEEPEGILKALGVEVHWTLVYHGQSKPIERAFRDLCETIAKHPKLAGAYTGNTPLSKPENYGSRAVPLADFLKVVESGINAHNAQTGRRSAVAAGRSFDETFAESYANAPIRKASAEQRRLWLLAAEGVLAAKPGGHIHLLGNRYWSECLARHAGQRLIVRFDPQNLHQPVHCYSLDGRHIGAADCRAPVGFADVEAGRAHAKAKQRWKRATKEAADAAIQMDITDAAAMLPDVPAPSAPSAGVIVPIFNANVPREPTQEETNAAFGRAVAMMKGSVK